MFKESTIIKSEEDLNKLEKLINVKLDKMLYQGSRDGFKAEDFHRMCDGHPNTIIIIKVKDGDTIGAYVSVKWESLKESKYVKDEKTFLFSLTKNKIYRIKEDYKYKAIYMSGDLGPYFGDFCNSTFCISSDCNTQVSYSRLGYLGIRYEINRDDVETFFGYSSLKDITYFLVDDYEVYECKNDKSVNELPGESECITKDKLKLEEENKILKEKYEKLKNDIIKLDEEDTKIKVEYKLLENENIKLKSENEELKSKIKLIYDCVKPIIN